MAEETILDGSSDDSINPGDDQTSITKDIQEEIDALPNEDGEEDDKDAKVERSEIAQKIRWREKYNTAQERIKELERSLEKPVSPKGQTEDEKELAAQKYIQEQARKAYQELIEEKEKQEKKTLAEFDDKVDTVLEDNPDITEDELLTVIEEFEVQPEVAVKIINKSREQTGKKPKLPVSRRSSGNSSSTQTEKPDNTTGEKTMWQLAQEAIKEYRNNKK